MKSTFLKSTVLIGIFILCSQSFIQAQSYENIELSKNNVYLDFNPGLVSQLSINYERQIHSGDKVSWYGRYGGGVSSIFLDESGPSGLGAFTMLTGKKNSHFELNAGAIIGWDISWRQLFAAPLFNIGYRYQKPKGGIIFRANTGILAVGISLGYAF